MVNKFLKFQIIQIYSQNRIFLTEKLMRNSKNLPIISESYECPSLAQIKLNNISKLQSTLRKQSFQNISQNKKQPLSQISSLQLKQKDQNKSSIQKLYYLGTSDKNKNSSLLIPRLSQNFNKKYEQKQNSFDLSRKQSLLNTSLTSKNQQVSGLKLMTLNSFKRSINKSMFQYYISQVHKQLKNTYKTHNKTQIQQQDEDTIFTQHLILSMCIRKAHKYTYIPKQIPQHMNNQSIVLQKFKNTSKKVLIFDMDETLIHSQTDLQIRFAGGRKYKDQHEIKVNKKLQNSNNKSIGNKKIDSQNSIYVNIRPYAKQVLKRLSQTYLIGLFTAAQKNYAQNVIKLLDPNSSIFSIKLFRQHCSQLNSSSSQIPISLRQRVKDLRILNNISLSLSQIILIDNSPISYLYQPQNAIPIIPFTNNSQDTQMLKLQSFLNNYIKDCTDVRTVLKDKFKVHQYGKFDSVRELMDKLFKCKDR